MNFLRYNLTEVRAAARCPYNIPLQKQHEVPFHRSEGCSEMPLQHHSAETTCDIVHGSEGRSKLPLQGLQQDALAGATCCGPHFHERCHILFQQSDAISLK